MQDYLYFYLLTGFFIYVFVYFFTVNIINEETTLITNIRLLTPTYIYFFFLLPVHHFLVFIFSKRDHIYLNFQMANFFSCFIYFSLFNKQVIMMCIVFGKFSTQNYVAKILHIVIVCSFDNSIIVYCMTYSIIYVLILLMMRKLAQLIPATHLARFCILISIHWHFQRLKSSKEKYQKSKSTSMLYSLWTKENALWVICAYTFVFISLPSHC